MIKAYERELMVTVDDIIKSAASDTVRTNEEEIINDESKNENESSDLSEKEKEEAAATRIQAVFRGHHARKSMKETDTASQQKRNEESEPEPTKEQLQEEFRADDVELCNAATKIQASFRGHMSRKEQGAPSVVKDAQDFVESAASKIEEKHASTQQLLGLVHRNILLAKACSRECRVHG
ncbi:hypothetical protein PV327_008212 [Microctonus hyperodae]|uniref:Sperm surface protein Sp17 n=1 Tax=Microctonus hyperodae TaxID=165561 RepID=A0AA39KGR3_MICHY|nr:hypothetical protein PV327_008212 [Microctonus hyperodae]